MRNVRPLSIGVRCASDVVRKVTLRGRARARPIAPFALNTALMRDTGWVVVPVIHYTMKGRSLKKKALADRRTAYLEQQTIKDPPG